MPKHTQLSKTGPARVHESYTGGLWIRDDDEDVVHLDAQQKEVLRDFMSKLPVSGTTSLSKGRRS